jgi:hypothetical protein
VAGAVAHEPLGAGEYFPGNVEFSRPKADNPRMGNKYADPLSGLAGKSAMLIEAESEWREDQELDDDIERWHGDWSQEECNAEASLTADALCRFAAVDDADAIRALMAANEQADANEPGSRWELPLCLASRRGCLKSARELVGSGARVGERGKFGDNALCSAAESARCDSSQAALVDFLIDGGARLEEPGRDGLTPFLVACRSWNIEVAKALIARGADQDAKSPGGLSARDLAEEDHRTWGFGGGRYRSGGKEEKQALMCWLGALAERGELCACAGEPSPSARAAARL